MVDGSGEQGESADQIRPQPEHSYTPPRICDHLQIAHKADGTQPVISFCLRHLEFFVGLNRERAGEVIGASTLKLTGFYLESLMSSDEDERNEVVRNKTPRLRRVGRGLVDARVNCPEDPQWYFAHSGAIPNASFACRKCLAHDLCSNCLKRRPMFKLSLNATSAVEM